MTRFQQDDPLFDLETLVRDAGDYIQVSPAVKSRLMDEARDQHSRSLRSRWLCLAVAILSVVTGLSNRPTIHQPQPTLKSLSISDMTRLDPLRVTGVENIFLVADALDQQSSEWGVVRLYYRVQQRRSDVFRVSI